MCMCIFHSYETRFNYLSKKKKECKQKLTYSPALHRGSTKHQTVIFSFTRILCRNGRGKNLTHIISFESCKQDWKMGEKGYFFLCIKTIKKRKREGKKGVQKKKKPLFKKEQQ